MSQRLPLAAVAAAALGVFLPWTVDGPVELDGTEGPHNGWLVLFVALFALGWLRSLRAGSWIGVVGVGGAGIVIVWTALESWLGYRAVTGGRPAVGLVLVVAGGATLAALAVLRAGEVARARRAASSRPGDEPASGAS
jgi:hypothetical protein